MGREFITGAEAIVRGAIDAGCDFFAGYPITPATPILLRMMRELPRAGGVAIQGEDEIASIGFCIGAAMAGRRALTATSGPGISLYSENLGLAVMAEVPLVVVDVQRMGPATGGATTVAQGDVQFVRWGTSGGYPVIALAPTNAAECYRLTMKAFDLAERFRTPVFLLTDKEVALTQETVDAGDFVPEPVRGRRTAAPEAEFVPYRFEQLSDVPAATPIGGPHLVRVNTSTHDERGLLTKDPAKVDRLNRHLAAKVEAFAEEIALAEADLQPEARTLVIAYGITARAMRGAVREGRRRGAAVSALTPYTLWPVPERLIGQAALGVERVVVAELNHGQYLREVERAVLRAACSAGVRPPAVEGLFRVDGETISPAEILDAILREGELRA